MSSIAFVKRNFLGKILRFILFLVFQMLQTTYYKEIETETTQTHNRNKNRLPFKEADNSRSKTEEDIARSDIWLEWKGDGLEEACQA